MDAQKIINSLNDSGKEESKLATTKMLCYRQSNSKK